jgi:hypothetical protein
LLPQSAFGQYLFSGYLYGGPSLGVTQSAPNAVEGGVGLDMSIARIELGVFNPLSDGNHTSGTFSAGGSIPFRTAGKDKLQFFAGAGYTRLFGSESNNSAYFGGGLKYWFQRKRALGFEVRDKVRTADGQQNLQIRFYIHFGIEV